MRTKALVLASVLVVGCASSKIDVLSQGDPAYDFDRHLTYKWTNAPLAETLPANAPKPAELDSLIRAAVNSELQERGYSLSDTPDLFVTYQVQVSKRVRADKDPLPAAWDPSYDLTDLAPVSLVVDLKDAKSNHGLVWRGGAFTDVQKGKGRKRVGEVVNHVLKDFPPRH